jgi:hypothetical protein
VSKTRRTFAFLVLTSLTSLTALSIIAVADAQVRKPAPAAAPAKKPAAKPGGRPLTPDSEDGGAPAALAGRDERAPAAAARDAGVGGGAVESKTLDGGTRVFRFGEVEVEGRLKSPQIVYFLRRVRAEFAAGDLGHRSFVRELSETRNEPGF